MANGLFPFKYEVFESKVRYIQTILLLPVMAIRHSDSFFFVASACCALGAAVDYSIFHIKQVQGHCFFFAKIYELKRIVEPGPAIACNGYLFGMYFNAFLMIWIAFSCCRKQNGGSPFQRTSLKFVGVFITVVGVTGFVLIKEGYHSVCNSLDFSPNCSSEVLSNLDFKTFRPKYMAAYRMPQHFVRCQASTLAHILFWCLGSCLHWLKWRQPFIFIGNYIPYTRSPLIVT